MIEASAKQIIRGLVHEAGKADFLPSSEEIDLSVELALERLTERGVAIQGQISDFGLEFNLWKKSGVMEWIPQGQCWRFQPWSVTAIGDLDYTDTDLTDVACYTIRDSMEESLTEAHERVVGPGKIHFP